MILSNFFQAANPIVNNSIVNNSHDQNTDAIFISAFIVLNAAATLLYCVVHFLTCNRNEHTFVDLDEDEDFIPNTIARRHSL